jgi:hypothetical protein
MHAPGMLARMIAEPDALSVLSGASAALARLDQALTNHPVAQAFLYRARLESVRQQAAVDGQLIDPWHLAATIEDLRLRMDPGRHPGPGPRGAHPAPMDRRARLRSGRGKLKIRTKSGHKPILCRFRRCGHPARPPIQLKITVTPALIGEAISGHSGLGSRQQSHRPTSGHRATRQAIAVKGISVSRYPCDHFLSVSSTYPDPLEVEEPSAPAMWMAR